MGRINYPIYEMESNVMFETTNQRSRFLTLWEVASDSFHLLRNMGIKTTQTINPKQLVGGKTTPMIMPWLIYG